MKSLLLMASLITLLSCQKSNTTVQTWQVKTGREKNPANSFCTWYGDSTVKVVFNGQPEDLAGLIKVYLNANDSTYYWEYIKLLN